MCQMGKYPHHIFSSNLTFVYIPSKLFRQLVYTVQDLRQSALEPANLPYNNWVLGTGKLFSSVVLVLQPRGVCPLGVVLFFMPPKTIQRCLSLASSLFFFFKKKKILSVSIVYL